MSFKIAKERCASCIFGSDSAIKGRPARFRQLQRDWRNKDTHQVCHAFGHGEDDEEGNETLCGEDVVCRGFYDVEYQQRGTGQMIRIAERLGCVEFVDQPEQTEEEFA